ncbi:MAG: formylglycine-generating enzyme family protein, partial [Nitrospiraceae bacterium]
TPVVPSVVCPFPGLEAFGENETQFFFGRQKEILDAVSCLGLGLDGVYRRWLQVEGTSGVGKSSLVKAGLIPTIKKGWAGSDGGATWRAWRVVEPMRPGGDPILNLAEAVSKCLAHEAGAISVGDCHRLLQGDDKAVQVGLRDWVPSGEALVLVIDQLEEVFTLTQDGKVRDRFDALLASALSDQDGPLHLVTTIRSDFMMQFTALPRLQALLHEKAFRYLLNPIDGNGLKDVVRAPAELAGLRWSDDVLPDEIVQEARDEPGALPLVENLLRLMWLESRNTQSNMLSRQVYNDLGGVGGALAKSADALLEGLGDGKQKALNLLTALVNVGGQGQDIQDTRRTIPKSVALQAAGGGAQAETILNQLSGLRGQATSRGAPARPRLVVLSSGTRDGVSTDLVDLAHETLLRYDRNKKSYWGTLRAEITKRRKAIENRQLAEALAKDWRDQGSPLWSRLATRAQYKTFQRLPDLSGDAAAYVKASLLVFASKLAVVGLLIVLFAGTAAALWEANLSVKYITTGFLARLHLVSVLEPEMVEIPGGDFLQGDVITRPNNPLRKVTVNGFMIGKYEVTFEEYDRYVELTGGRSPNDETLGRQRRPVTDVMWEDAVGYARWLSKATGKRYRLPTEAEWDYAARSGEKDAVWAGTSDENQLKDYAVYGVNSKQVEPVGSKKPNGFGLYDMSGNVWEFVEDCFAQAGNECGFHMLRGGCRVNKPEHLRVSYQHPSNVGSRGKLMGFRLAHDIPYP